MDEVLKQPLSEGDKGLTTWFIAFGNKAVEKPSNLLQLKRIVCGKELLTLTTPGAIEIKAEKDSGATEDKFKDIAAAEYAAWFNIDSSGENTDP